MGEYFTECRILYEDKMHTSSFATATSLSIDQWEERTWQEEVIRMCSSMR